MEAKFSPRVKDMISYSRDEAVRLSNEFVGAEHLLLGLIRLNEGTAVNIINEFKLDLAELKAELEKILDILIEENVLPSPGPLEVTKIVFLS